MDLVRAGNDRAFEAIVHRYRRPLMRYCGRFLAPARAEDAVQQTFLNAYRSLKADERAIDLRPWLYRIAHNAALNALRAGAAGEEPISEELDGVERPDQAFERREKLADIVAAVQALPPRQRDAIVLHELEGRSYDQIAQELRISGGAVRQLLSRARTTLRAGATAFVPETVLVRLASGGGEPVAARVAEIVTAGGGTAMLAKVGTAVVIAGAAGVGAVEGPLDDEPAPRERSARQAVVASAPSTPGAASAAAVSAGPDEGAAAGRALAVERANGRRGERRKRGRGRGRGGDDDRRGGFIEGDGESDDRSGAGEDSERDDDDDRSGSSGDDDRSGSDGGSDDGDDSGPRGGSDDAALVAQEPDSSGPGSGSSDGRSGSGSGSGSGSDDPVLTVPEPDGSSRSGSGSDDR